MQNDYSRPYHVSDILYRATSSTSVAFLYRATIIARHWHFMESDFQFEFRLEGMTSDLRGDRRMKRFLFVIRRGKIGVINVVATR